MKKKMLEIGKKTGLQVREVNNLTKIGITGFLALSLSVLCGIVTANAAEQNTRESIVQKNKCEVAPNKCSGNGSVTRYYFDSKTGTCEAFSTCDPSSGFENYWACKFECKESQYPVSKYGGISGRDFENAK